MTTRQAAKGFAIAFATIAAVATAASCRPERSDKATLLLSIRQENTFATKAAGDPLPDTNQFVLKIENAAGENVYYGLYGSRPERISVPAGSYSLSLVSEELDAPEWECPVYGDAVDIVAASGETVSVNFLCKMVNSGVRIRMTDRYIARYPGSLTVAQEAGSLDYTSSETRFGFFEAGNATFSAVASDGSRQQLFSKQFTAGQMLTLTLDASTMDAGGLITVQLDTTANYLSQTIMVDQYRETQGDGLSRETAYSVVDAALHPEEQVWVWGYIVGGDLTSSGINYEAPFSKNSNLAIAASPMCRTRTECMSVELASGSDIRETVNLVEHPDMLGRKIYIKGTIKDSYFGMTGIKSVSEFSLD